MLRGNVRTKPGSARQPSSARKTTGTNTRKRRRMIAPEGRSFAVTYGSAARTAIAAAWPPSTWAWAAARMGQQSASAISPHRSALGVIVRNRFSLHMLQTFFICAGRCILELARDLLIPHQLAVRLGSHGRGGCRVATAFSIFTSETNAASHLHVYMILSMG